ncbi:MAG: hypothetical protein AAFX99_26595, partial [Myxococcota bacterium]
FQWTQRAGPPVTLSDPSSPTPSWTTPNEPTAVIFDLQVSDGEAWSDTDTVTVTIGQTYTGQRARFTRNPYRETLQTPGPVHSIARQGAAMMLTDLYNGIYLVDLTQPQDPFLLGEVNLDGLTTGLAMESLERVYISQGADGVTTWDLSEPAEPLELGRLETPGWAASVTWANGLLYVADRSAGLMVVDMTDPATPEVLGTLALDGLARDISVVDGVAYVAATYGGLFVVDVSQPTAPTLLSHVATEAEALLVRPGEDDTLLFLADSTQLRIWDRSDPHALRELGSWDAGSAILGMELDGSRLAMATSDRGLQIVDLSNPGQPERLDVYDTPGSGEDVAIVQSIAYVADGVRGLQIIRLAEQGRNQPPSVINAQTEVRALAPGTERAWIVTADELAFLDPWTLELSKALSPVNAQEVALDTVQQRAWLVMERTELTALDTLDPLAPQTLGSWSAPEPIITLAVEGNRAYTITETSGLHVLDTTNPATPTLLGSTPISGTARALQVKDNRAWVASTAGLQTFDVSRIGSPRLISTTGQRVRALAQGGNLLVLATDYQGLMFMDITDPLAPPTPVDIPIHIEQPIDLCMDGALLYVASGQHEVQAWDLTDRTAPEWVGTWATSSQPTRLVQQGNTLLATIPGRGLQVLELPQPGLEATYEFAAPRQTLVYTLLTDDIQGYNIVCTVTGGSCEVDLGAEGEQPLIRWYLPPTIGDYEIAIAAGNYHTFRQLGTDQVFVRP